ncbi:MAG: LuxR C-terminal-related transcriptional regulator [Acidimicrobiales bacterium]|nr:LuxR C-terminal-related transcriptional regulator [Acidimicrobiales bacterium]
MTGGSGRVRSTVTQERGRASQRLWPLIGRDHELDLTVEALEAGQGVVLAGRAGVGKTRLAREATGRVASSDGSVGGAGDGLYVEWVTVTDTGVPIGPFAPLLEEVPLATLGPQPRPPAALLRRALEAKSNGRPVLLVVDDAHLLDDFSAALLLHLSRSPRLTLLATIRSGVPCPDAVVALWKDDQAIRLELQPLTRPEIASLLAAVLGAPATESTVDRLLAVTSGNTLFLRELVADGVDSGALEYSRGWWNWTGHIRAPRRLSEVIDSHLRRLDPAAREVVEYVALAEPLRFIDLSSLAGERLVEELVEHDVLSTSTEEGVLMVRLGHPLIGEVLLAGLSDPRRRRLLGCLLDRLPVNGSLRDLLRRVAWLAELERDVDPADLLAAARQCAMVAPALARRLATRALSSAQRPAALVTLAQIDLFAGRSAEAEATLSSLDPSDVDDIWVPVMRANNLAFGLRRPEEALRLLERLGSSDKKCAGSAQTGTTGSDRQWLDGQRVPMLLLAGRLDQVIQCGHDLLRSPTAGAADRMRARMGLVPALALIGSLDDAVDLAHAGLFESHQVRDELPYAVGQLGAGLMLALQWSARFAEADALARIAYDQGVADDVALQRGVAALYLGLVAFWRGQVPVANRWFAAATTDLLPADLGFLPSAADHWRVTCALLGQHGEVPEVGSRLPLYEPERLRLEGMVAAARGAMADARRLEREAVQRAQSMDAVTYALFALVDLARFGDPARAAAGIDGMVRMPDGPLAADLAAAVAGLSERDPRVLLENSTRLEAIGLRLHAAEWAAAASTEFQRQGSASLAKSAQLRALTLADACGRPRTPLLRRLVELEHPALTGREREIAELVASGNSNRDVADRLGLSVRTVESHLQRVYTKLAINSRQELADLFQLG